MQSLKARWGALTTAFVLAVTAGCATKPAVIQEKAGQEPTTYSAHLAHLAHCGVERWSVKTGTDPDAPSVHIRGPAKETVEYLTSLPKQSYLPSDNRLGPTETTEYVVDATLVGYKLESDSDYHLVIQGSNGQTMIAEIPAPTCVGSNSPFAAEIKNARDEFDSAYHATTKYKRVSVPVRVRGIGYFDFDHRQTGLSKTNAIELHPLLDILFNP